MGLRVLQAGRVTAAERAARAGVCGLTVMAKAPRAGRVKTRLSPPLTAEEAAGLSVSFLRDTLENLAGVAGGVESVSVGGDAGGERVPGAKALVDSGLVMPGLKSRPISETAIPRLESRPTSEAGSSVSEASSSAARDGMWAAGLICYTPVGDEAAFEGVAPEGFALVAQREGDFGQRLLGAAAEVLACGFGSVCLIDSDSPTVPRAAYERAVRELGRAGERVVLGPAEDGGYYLIGIKRARAEVFAGIQWSTATVYAETCARARAAGLEVVELPLWYDVDDGATLEILRAELLAGMRPGFAVMEGYEARWTREFLMGMR